MSVCQIGGIDFLRRKSPSCSSGGVGGELVVETVGEKSALRSHGVDAIEDSVEGFGEEGGDIVGG